MLRLRLFLFAFSMLWIAAWSLIGTLIGSRLNALIQANTSLPPRDAWQIKLLTSVHAHMNTMALMVGLLALALPHLSAVVSFQKIKICTYGLLSSIILFGLGLIFEAYVFGNHISTFWRVAPTTVGAAGFLLFTTAFGMFFLLAAKN